MRAYSISILAAILAVITVDSAWGYGSGAPNTVCGTMTPGHGVEQATANSYTITLAGATTYREGQQIEVTINGQFQGLLLQARKADGSSTTPYGTFVVNPANNVKTISCNQVNDNSVTHASTAPKNNLVVTWTAPSSDVGDLQFVATVAQEMNTWWKNIQSSTLAHESSAAEGITSAPTSAAPESELGTTEGNSDEVDSEEEQDDPTSAAGMLRFTSLTSFTLCFLATLLIQYID